MESYWFLKIVDTDTEYEDLVEPTRYFDDNALAEYLELLESVFPKFVIEFNRSQVRVNLGNLGSFDSGYRDNLFDALTASWRRWNQGGRPVAGVKLADVLKEVATLDDFEDVLWKLRTRRR